MFKKNKFKSTQELPLDRRFLNTHNKELLKKIFSSNIQKEGILKTISYPKKLDIISSNVINNFYKDQNFNLQVNMNLYNNLSSDIENHLQTNKETIKSLFKSTKILETDLIAAQLNDSSSDKKTSIVNFFSKDKDLQYIKEQSSLYEDPKTKSNISKNYMLQFFDGAGFTLPISNTNFISYNNVFLDNSKSELGNKIIEKTDILNLLNDKGFKILFFQRQKDDTNNLYTKKDSYEIGITFQFGGYQSLNKIDLIMDLPSFIKSISYLDNKENEKYISYDEIKSTGKMSLVFDTIITNNITLVLGTRYSSENLLFEGELGQLYSFSIRDVNFSYNEFINTGYYLSYPKKIKKIYGVKLISKFNSSKYILESYLRVENYNKTNNLISYKTIPLLENYSTANRFVLYFINNKASLDFFPSPNFLLYKNNTRLYAGTDFWFFTDKDATLVENLAEVDFTLDTQVFIYLKDYDSFAKYICSYIPNKNMKSKLGYTYNNDVLYIDDLDNTSNIYMFNILRQINDRNNDYPVYEGYILEVYHESE